MNEESLFHLALQQPEASRAAFVDQACANQPELRARLEGGPASSALRPVVVGDDRNRRPRR